MNAAKDTQFATKSEGPEPLRFTDLEAPICAAPPASPDQDEDTPFRRACDMENPLATIHDLLAGIAVIAATLGIEEGSAIQRIAWLGVRECEAAEELRVEMFRLTHPRRYHFEKEGWPS